MGTLEGSFSHGFRTFCATVRRVRSAYQNLEKGCVVSSWAVLSRVNCWKRKMAFSQWSGWKEGTWDRGWEQSTRSFGARFLAGLPRWALNEVESENCVGRCFFFFHTCMLLTNRDHIFVCAFCGWSSCLVGSTQFLGPVLHGSFSLRRCPSHMPPDDSFNTFFPFVSTSVLKCRFGDGFQPDTRCLAAKVKRTVEIASSVI